jgi:DMSO reductase family type II enzyme chaperone
MPDGKPRLDRTPATAQARSAAYALFSQLVTSPFDAPSFAAALPPEDLPEAAAELHALLPYELDLEPLAAAAGKLGEADAERLARAYSGLFEVGSDGAPVPLREELAGAAAAKAKEETVRFYDFFGYALAEERQWAPDHLAVQLEFLHFLAFRESREREPERLLSYRLAQRDFLERHPLSWVPELVSGVRSHAREPYWRALFETLGAFLDADAAWQRRTLAEEA